MVEKSKSTEKVNRFALVNAIVIRANQIREGAKPLIDGAEGDAFEIAIDELNSGLITVKQTEEAEGEDGKEDEG